VVSCQKGCASTEFDDWETIATVDCGRQRGMLRTFAVTTTPTNNTFLQETTGRVSYAQSLNNSTLDRSYEYDLVGRVPISHSSAEARADAVWGQWGTKDDPYSLGFDYDVWGNMMRR